MIDGVADEMQERLGHDLEHLPVNLDVDPAHPELNLLAELSGELGHGARKRLEDLAERHHPELSHVVGDRLATAAVIELDPTGGEQRPADRARAMGAPLGLDRLQRGDEIGQLTVGRGQLGHRTDQ